MFCPAARGHFTPHLAALCKARMGAGLLVDERLLEGHVLMRKRDEHLYALAQHVQVVPGLAIGRGRKMG